MNTRFQYLMQLAIYSYMLLPFSGAKLQGKGWTLKSSEIILQTRVHTLKNLYAGTFDSSKSTHAWHRLHLISATWERQRSGRAQVTEDFQAPHTEGTKPGTFLGMNGIHGIHCIHSNNNASRMPKCAKEAGDKYRSL